MNGTYAAAMLKKRMEAKRIDRMFSNFVLPGWQEIEDEIRSELKGKHSQEHIEMVIAKTKELHHR